MQLSVDSFELIFIQLLSTKLDHSTFKLWKESIDCENLSNFQNFVQFLNARRQLLENTLPLEAGQQLNKPIPEFNHKSEKSKLQNSAGSTVFKSYHSTSNNYSCLYLSLIHI